jgi:hypothetical protein
MLRRSICEIFLQLLHPTQSTFSEYLPSCRHFWSSIQKKCADDDFVRHHRLVVIDVRCAISAIEALDRFPYLVLKKTGICSCESSPDAPV